jgi:hypothetical protein
MDQAAVTAKKGALGTNLGGTFELEFELGPEASGPATVSLGDFALQTAAGSPIVDPLPADASGTSFPLVVAKGGTQTVTFALSSKEQLTDDQYTAICAGPVIIVGSVTDSLKGGIDPVRSSPITPTCS